MKLNKLLERQVKNYLGTVEDVPLQLAELLTEISKSYDQYENNLSSLARSIDKNSDEMIRINNKLRDETDELKKAHNELGRIFNSVNLGFFSRDMTLDKYIYLSHGCEKIYGYTVEEFFNNPLLWYDVIYPDDRQVVALDDKKLNNAEQLYTHYRIIHKDKSLRWLELKVIPHFTNGKLTRVDGVVNDITLRKQVEAERESMITELMKSNADLKQFSYITSHNLRAPLSNILGILNVLDYPDRETYNGKMLEMLKESVQQLNNTIADLTRILIIKNNVNPNLTGLDLEESFHEVNKTFLIALDEAGGIVFTDFKAASVSLNKVYLESIFINLMSNAIRYRATDRKLIVQITSEEDEYGNVLMNFSDNGTGIDLTRHKDRVFGLYQRFHDNGEGQGLGLFIMKSQIEATGGKIDIESQPGKGTTFIITFKKQAATVAAPMPAISQAV